MKVREVMVGSDGAQGTGGGAEGEGEARVVFLSNQLGAHAIFWFPLPS